MQDYRRGQYEGDDRRSRGRSSYDRPGDTQRYRQDFSEQRFRGRDDRDASDRYRSDSERYRGESERYRGEGERYRGESERSWRDQGDGFAESRERYDNESQFAPFEPGPSEYSLHEGGFNDNYDRRYGRGSERSEQDWSGSRQSQPSSYYGGYREDQGPGMYGVPGGEERGRRDWQSSGRHQTQAVGRQHWSWGDRFGWNTGQQSYAGRGPKNYQRSDDRIREEVSDRLTDDSRIDASDISVDVRNCEVTLSGTVNDRDQKRRAEDLAESITGVKEVTNNIRLARQAESADQSSRSGILTGGAVGSKSKPTVGA